MHKRIHSSTASEATNTDSSLLDNTVFENSNSKTNAKSKKKTSKPDTKKQKTIETYTEMVPRENGSHSENVIKKQLDEISAKLSKVLTKDDTSFIKDIIKETVEQLKEKLLGSVLKRLEILEGTVFEQKSDIEFLKTEIQSKDTQIEKLKSEIHATVNEKNKESNKYEEIANTAEQYSRRNNLRMTGVPGDQDRQSSIAVTTQVVSLVNRYLNIPINESDIDIAHRLGKFKQGENRPVIIKFVRRQIKVDIVKNSKRFKGSGIFVNDDLTKLNAEVLASTRLKDPQNVERAWSFEGSIYVLFKGNQQAVQIKYADYKSWLEKSWPKKSYSQSVEQVHNGNQKHSQQKRY